MRSFHGFSFELMMVVISTYLPAISSLANQTVERVGSKAKLVHYAVPRSWQWDGILQDDMICVFQWYVRRWAMSQTLSRLVTA